MSTSYADLVAQAEAAVGAVKDPELRRVAFEKVLDSLLSGSAPRTSPQSDERPKKGGHKATDAKPVRSKAGGPAAYLQELVDDGFFKKPQGLAAVNAELVNRGHHIPKTSLSGPLQKLCQKKVLRRQKVDGSFSYSNW